MGVLFKGFIYYFSRFNREVDLPLISFKQKKKISLLA